MTEEMMKKLQTTQRRMIRMIIDPGSDQEEDTTEANPQDTNEQEESNQDADSIPSFDSVPKDE